MTRVSALAIISSCLFVLSCYRVEKETKFVKSKAKYVATETRDKIFPIYDSYKPDTKYNKRRFKEFFGFWPTSDVKNIYCHADQMGIDHDYSFAFTCNRKTIQKIETNLSLQNDSIPETHPSGLFHDFDWWHTTKIDTLKPSWRKGDHQKYYFLWYDSINCDAYYFEYDL
ncbi:MAG: hypothetical protein ACFHU9_03340 [Fluviicola sp.]